MKATPYDDAVRERFMAELRSLWPAAKGSLAEVRKPCIRPTCAACASGRKHPAFILSVKAVDGHRRCLHVPRELAPVLRQAIRNGRQIEQMLSRTAGELLQQYRQSRSRGGSRRSGKA